MEIYLPFILSFILSIIIAPIYIGIANRIKFGQNILGYVSEHQSKQGTPTTGGVIFILPTIISSVIFSQGDKLISCIVLAVFFAYGIVGFLDDFIKIKFKRNLGLRAYQKIIFQLLIAIIIATFVFKNNLFAGVYLPYTYFKINLGIFIIPLVVIIFLATTNSVNLTDGLDGLASGTSIVFFIIFALLNSYYMKNIADETFVEYIVQLKNLNVISNSITGALTGFLLYNFYPAKIFMGDTGSLALGALIAILCILSGLSLYLPILGVMFVLSSVSVILQVLHFKRTGKRIFLMAPFHHHLQHKGMYETKITLIYIIVTLIVGLTTLAIIGGL